MSESTLKRNLSLESDIQFIKGVGPKLATVFYRQGIKTVKDFIENYPRAYEDRRAVRQISNLKDGDVVSIKASVVGVASYSLGRSSRKVYDVLVKDSSGQIRCKFFRTPYKGYFERFKPFQEVRIVGKVTQYRGRIEFHHPEIQENVNEELQDVLRPIYVEIEGVASQKIHQLIKSAFQQIKDYPQEIFSDQDLKKMDFISKAQAYYEIHHPVVEWAEKYHQFQSRAQRRLIFEEFFWLEMYLASKKTGLKNEKGIVLKPPGHFEQELLRGLSFELTKAQIQVIQEIKNDFKLGKPMNRLVQGDVGSGKTMVSFVAALTAIESGYQACLMAPTEILAEQHFKNAQKIFSKLNLQLGLITGKTKAKEKAELIQRCSLGEIHFLIGTHALIEEGVQFQKLALVVIDEQHRFGVEQRAKLKSKGESPHFLVMTATPIPRTLAMTVYGDLDVSMINEMPKGRTPIQTRVITDSKRAQAVQFMIEQIQKGRQAYVVYPLVEDSEKIDLKNATDEYEKLKLQFPKIRFGLLHGQMKPLEKESVMDQFRRHEIDVLISTTVIEVGVDVPNATLMMIEHAERFGLSQLHQLRGRVGRGAHKSFCVMIMGYAVSAETKQRVEFMEKTTDGFKIAEFDLELRGPGEFLGARQSGLPGFKIAHLIRDIDLLKQSRDLAFDLFQRDPKLQNKEHLNIRNELLKSYGPTALAGIG